MRRLLTLLTALLLAVTPTVDTLCRALCTADATAATAPFCHEVAAAADGTLVSATSCERDATPAVAPADGKRSRVPPAPLVRLRTSEVAYVAAARGADVSHSMARARPPQVCQSTIVLRI